MGICYFVRVSMGRHGLLKLQPISAMTWGDINYVTLHAALKMLLNIRDQRNKKYFRGIDGVAGKL